MTTSRKEFARLFDRHARTVCNYCFRRTGDWTLAEDLTSTVFLEAWRRRRDVQIADSMARAWLLGVATNVLRNYQRSQRRYAAALSRLPPEANEVDFSDDLTTRLDSERQMRDFLAIFRSLPRKHQEVIALCVWSELSYPEAALALHVPVGTVRSRLSRAKRRLAEVMTEAHSLTSSSAMRPADEGA